MRLVKQLVCCGAAILLAPTETITVNGGTSTKVTTRVQVPAHSTAPVLFSDYGQSGSDTYVTTSGKTGVSSVFQPGGDWQLDTTSRSRAVWIDLGDPTQPFNAQFVHALLTTHCAYSATTPVAFLIGVGSSTTCPMSLRINWGTTASVFYRIHFNSIRYPGTGDVTFSCNQAGSNNGCIDWSARPADDDSLPGDGRSSGQLVKVTTTRTSETETLIGYYDVNFEIHITKP